MSTLTGPGVAVITGVVGDRAKKVGPDRAVLRLIVKSLFWGGVLNVVALVG